MNSRLQQMRACPSSSASLTSSLLPASCGQSARCNASRARRAFKPVAASPKVTKTLTGPCVVKLTAEKSVSCSVVPRQGSDTSLDKYMSRAADNFANIELPLGGKITRVDSSHVELVVPRIQIFDVWLQPRAIAELSTYAERIEFESNTENVGLDGSSHVKDFRLDERFNLHVHITFRWTHDTETEARGNTSGTESESDIMPTARIDALGTLMIEVDIPPPFSFMPKHLLTSAGNTAVAATMSIILNSFVSSLARDYSAWASDPSLRSKRLQVPV